MFATLRAIVLEADLGLSGVCVCACVQPGGGLSFDASPVTLGDYLNVLLSFVVVSQSGLTGPSPALTTTPSYINLHEVIPGKVINNGGTHGCNSFTHVAYQASPDVVSVCWTPFKDTTTSTPPDSCSWGVRRAGDTVPFVVFGAFPVPCSALTTSIDTAGLTPGTSYLIDVVASVNSIDYISTSPPFKVLLPPQVVVASTEGYFPVFQATARVCHDFDVSYLDPSLRFTVTAGRTQCADDVPLTNTTVNGVTAQVSDGTTTVTACGTTTTPAPVTLFVALTMCDPVERCSTFCGAHMIVIDTTPPDVSQAEIKVLPLWGWTGYSQFPFVTQQSDDLVECRWVRAPGPACEYAGDCR